MNYRGETMDKKLKIFAQTIYGESDVNNLQDATAIASVIMNRVKYKNWPNDIVKVCQQKWQFSCWNGRFTKTKGDLAHIKRMENAEKQNPVWWNKCVQIAEMAMNGMLADPTFISTHYYATYWPVVPTWAIGKTPVYKTDFTSDYLLGEQHIFFNDIDTKRPVLATPADKPTPPALPKEELEPEIVAKESSDDMVCDIDDKNCKPRPSAKKVATVAGGTATGIAAAGEAINQISPAFPLMTKMLAYMPWLVGGIVILGIGFIIWNWYQNKKDSK